MYVSPNYKTKKALKEAVANAPPGRSPLPEVSSRGQATRSGPCTYWRMLLL